MVEIHITSPQKQIWRMSKEEQQMNMVVKLSEAAMQNVERIMTLEQTPAMSEETP